VAVETLNMSAAPDTDVADWVEVDLPRPKPAMPHVGEWMTPWVAASLLVSVLTVAFVVGGRELPFHDAVLLTISIAATLTAGVLVTIRAGRAREASVLEERARPPAEALEGAVREVGTAAYVEGMASWTARVLELLEHARGCATDGTTRAADLAAAIDETRDLCHLLEASVGGDLDINAAAEIHAVCTLWETNQRRIEQLAASCDPPWHRRWSARAVADRRLRHGGRTTAPLAIPYRS
jgi:hypothetical protein